MFKHIAENTTHWQYSEFWIISSLILASPIDMYTFSLILTHVFFDTALNFVKRVNNSTCLITYSKCYIPFKPKESGSDTTSTANNKAKIFNAEKANSKRILPELNS